MSQEGKFVTILNWIRNNPKPAAIIGGVFLVIILIISGSITKGGLMSDCEKGDAIACKEACNRGEVKACVNSCNNGDAESCKQACNKGDAEACKKACLSGVTRSCKKACEQGDAEACEEAKGYSSDNAPFGEDNAIAYYRKWCDRDKGDACNRAGRMLYSQRKYKEAFVLYEKSCNLGGDGSCMNVGVMYEQGQGVEKNIAKSFEYYQKACDDLHNGQACTELANKYLKAKDEAKAFEYTNKACNEGDGEGCYRLGIYYEIGRGVSQDNKKAMMYFSTACKILHYQDACSSMKNLQ